MNASRDQAMLGLALQQGLINPEQAALVKDRQRQFAEAHRPVSVSGLLRALKFLTDEQLAGLDQAVEQARTQPAPAATVATQPPGPGERRRTTGAQRGSPAQGVPAVQRSSPPQGAPVAARGSPAQGVPIAQPGSGAPAGAVKQLGKYRLLKPLGQGGMGTVYLAEDSHLNRKVALKVLPRELAANRDFIKRFLAEARVTGKLSHPNIVVAYDIDSSQNVWFMAMEYLEGESLGRRVLRDGAIPWREALGMLRQVLKGLAYAHKNGIIHRDIKPDNLFLDKTSGEAKILDLGLSKNLHAQENSALTQAGMILGTPNYLAPEQAENGINVDHRADLYSLGATLYHVLTGAPPFDGTTPLAIIQKHLFEPFPDLRKSKPDIPVDVANLVWKMTAKRPADRFADCNAALAAVEDILEGRGFKLSDPLIAGGRRPGSSPRNRPPTGSGSNPAVRTATRNTRGTAAIDRRSRTATRRGLSPIGLFSMLGVGAVILVGGLAWILQSPTPPTTAANNPTHPAGSSHPNPGDTPPTGSTGGTPAVPPTSVPATQTGPDGAADPGDTLDAILAVTTGAGRGLTLSTEIDHQLETEEKNAAMRRLLDASHAGSPGGPPTAGNPTAAPGPTPPTSTQADPFDIAEPAPPILHTLTAAERKTAGKLLDHFDGEIVFRMAAPAVSPEDGQQANLRNLQPAELGGINFFQLGPPPRQRTPDFYQAVMVEPDNQPTANLRPGARIRMIVKLDTSDHEAADLRLMFSDFPVAGGVRAGGAYASMVPCDYTLIDVPVQMFKRPPAERPWFGYACGDGNDFKAKRQLTFTVSDVIVYNPK